MYMHFISKCFSSKQTPPKQQTSYSVWKEMLGLNRNIDIKDMSKAWYKWNAVIKINKSYKHDSSHHDKSYQTIRFLKCCQEQNRLLRIVSLNV